jgi:tRNA threonylcarbamoyladenosine biosynthesis protein TsaB
VKTCIIGETMTLDAKPDSCVGLALETSSALGSVALGYGDSVLEVRELSGPRRHAVEFLPTVAAICDAHTVKPASIRRIYVSSGPGSFTGLRIGVTAARMIGLANAARIVAVPTLEVIAQNALGAATQPERAAVVLDAKRGRVYAACFVREGGRFAPETEPIEADPSRFLADCTAQPGSCAVLGEGVLYHREAVEASGLPILPESLYPPRAEIVYRLGVARAAEGSFTDRRNLIPTYVRPPEAEEKWEERHKKK